jgi:hypothetical protein
LVQLSAKPIGSSIDKIRLLLSFLGEPRIKQKDRNTTLIFTFESEMHSDEPSLQKMTSSRAHMKTGGSDMFKIKDSAIYYRDDQVGRIMDDKIHFEDNTLTRVVLDRSRMKWDLPLRDRTDR